MNGLLLIIVGVIYIVVGIKYYLNGDIGLCIAFISYALANVGLYLSGAK